ncbi:hypothetical protein GGX14DRAFT_563073 [Mycena pura]|uniref:Uncharacterized protein n=1 Tax=Mycena pura TaxID=153505 RepID=A0AAD6VLD9_9AGAR|nr:hypothetical protein GGX14DRAFT_563073 [Mycena pura]
MDFRHGRSETRQTVSTPAPPPSDRPAHTPMSVRRSFSTPPGHRPAPSGQGGGGGEAAQFELNASESTWSARTCRLFTPGVRRTLVRSVGTTAALCSLTRFRRTSRTAVTYCPAQSVHGRLFFLTPLAAAASRRPMPAGARRALRILY